MWKPSNSLNIILSAVILAACAEAPSPTPIPETATAGAGATLAAETMSAVTDVPTYNGDGPWSVDVPTNDGTTTTGTLYGQGNIIGVVLVPTYPGGQQGWRQFALQSAAAGYRTLSIDLQIQEPSAELDNLSGDSNEVLGAVTFLKELGIDKIVVIGAGVGAMATIEAATSDSTWNGMIILSSPRSLGGIEITDTELANLTVPSLWIATRNDMLQDIESMYDAINSSSKDLWIYEGSSLHGTYIFEGADSADASRRILEFIAQVTPQ